MSAKQAPETYQQMVDRIAWALMHGIVRGESLMTLSHAAANTAIRWNIDMRDREAAAEKAAKQQKRKNA